MANCPSLDVVASTLFSWVAHSMEVMALLQRQQGSGVWQGQQSDWRRRPGQMRDGQRQQGSDESVNTRACRFATRQRQWQPCRRRFLCSAMCSCLPARMLEDLGAQQDSNHLHTRVP